MKKIQYIFLILTVFYSCSKKANRINSNSAIFPWEYSNEQISLLFDSIEYLTLEAHPDGVFKNLDKLMIYNNKYVVFDYFGQNQLSVFSEDGRFLYKIGKKGNAPGEYVEIRNFTINKDRIYLIDNRLNKILIYNAFNGNFIEDKILPFCVHDMAIGDDGNYIFAQQKIQGEKPAEFQCYNIFITDSDLNVKYSLFHFEEEHCGIRSQLQYFTQTDQYIVFRTMVADSIIFFDKNGLSDKYNSCYIDFGSHKLNRKFENDDEMLKNYNYLYSTPIITSKYIVGTYWAGKDYGSNSYIYDKEKKKVFVENDNNSQFFFTPVLSRGDTVYSIYSHDYFNLWQNINQQPTLPEHVIKHLIAGDDVLVKYILR